MRLAEPVAAITTVATVAQGIGTVLFEPIFDTEVDFFMICRCAQSSDTVSSWHLSAACWSGWRSCMAVRRPSVRRGRARDARVAKRNALERA